MTNPYYVPSGQPATGAFAASAPMRTEFNSIEDGFDLLPPLTASRAIVVNSGGTALTVTTGTLALAGNFATVGAYAVTLTATAATGVTLPTTGTLATLAGVETLSNKTLVAPALGTPVSGVATNLTGTAAGLTAGNVTTNANLTGPITSVGNATSVAAQTGTGSTFVMNTSPTLVTPVLGVATATSINKVAITAPASGATLTISDGKTLAASASITLAGTDSTTMTFPSTSATIARTDAANTFTGIQTFSTPIASASMAEMTATVGGRVPTPPNDASLFLNGQGAFTTPPTGVTLLATLTASTSATLDDTTHITSTYTSYLFVYTNIVPATDGVEFRMRVSTDASTFITTGYLDTAGNTNGIVIAAATDNSASHGLSGWSIYSNPSDASNVKYLLSTVLRLGTDGTTLTAASVGGWYNTANTAINGVRFMMESGNISTGTVKIYGMT